MFKRSPSLTYLYGALDTTPPPPKVSSFALLVSSFLRHLCLSQEKKNRPQRQPTKVKDLVATQDTTMQEVCHIFSSTSTSSAILVNMQEVLFYILLANHSCCLFVSPLNLFFFWKLANLSNKAESSDNQTEKLVGHVFKCLVSVWKEKKEPVNFFR